MLILSIRNYSAGRKVRGDKMQYHLYLQEYIFTLNRNSDTVEALSLAKRVYAILCKNECLVLVLSLSERVYTFSFEKEMSSQKKLH